MIDHASSVSTLLRLNPTLTTLKSFDAVASTGLPFFRVDSLIKVVFGDHDKAHEFMQRLLSGTYNPSISEVLTPATPAQVDRLARTFALANYVFDDLNDTRAFFTNQHRLFNGQTPLDIAMTELRAIRVSQLLQQLYFGVLPHIKSK